MAKVVVIACDRCDRRIRQGKKKSEHDAPVHVLAVTGGDRPIRRDLCAKCKSDLEQFMRNAKPEKTGPPAMDSKLMEELQNVREIANRGIRAYSDGASAHDLVASLRDVASGARRGA